MIFIKIWKNTSYLDDGDILLVDELNLKYINSDIIDKASKIVTNLDTNFNKETIKVENIKEYMYFNYIDKIKDVKLIGITGTNGKTTTCYLIYQMLNYLGYKTAYIGTIGYYVEDKIIDLDNTTPDFDIIYNLILDAKEKECIYVVMEVSSHALKQDRLYKLLFDVICVTNITQDHLDYHKNMNDYINSKRLILNKLKNNRICILNKKDKHYKKFIKKNNNNVILGKDYKIKKIIQNVDGSRIFFDDIILNTSLVGKFNAYNFIYAYLVIMYLGLNTKKIMQNSKSFIHPKGRMEKINYKKSVIFIDYAHTPDAVSNVLKTVKKINKKGIITIIGCGGNRDKLKRSKMGYVACKYSSYVIFTNDNPRFENEEDIIKDILSGAKKNYEVIYDRKTAIIKGISLLKNNNILLILGKGHEEYQIINNEKKYFSDLEIVENYLKKIK